MPDKNGSVPFSFVLLERFFDLLEHDLGVSVKKLGKGHFLLYFIYEKGDS